MGVVRVLEHVILMLFKDVYEVSLDKNSSLRLF